MNPTPDKPTSTGTPIPPALRRPELTPLWQALHERLSSGRDVGKVRAGPLDGPAQAALADLLGLDRLPGTYPHVRLPHLDATLRDICGLNARDVVTALLGPPGDRAAARATARAERAALWHHLDNHPLITAQPALTTWTDHIRRTGVPGGGTIEAARRLLDDALRTLAALPAEGEPLPVFAATVLGDPHRLDDGTRLSTLVLRGLAALYGTDPPESAADRRTLWAHAGIADDALSATVLTAGLRPGGGGATARALTTLSEAGHATHLTLAQLRDASPVRFSPATVHITENPSIIALALRRFGPACPPLVCTSGWPNSAGVLLLRRLAEAGAPLLYHGDFDGEGLRIAAHVMARTGATPWRMTTADYLSALDRVPTGPDPGRIPEAPWDPALAPTLRTSATAVVEEHVAHDLLTDLEQATDA